jgi:predicted nucleotidyltransferase
METIARKRKSRLDGVLDRRASIKLKTISPKIESALNDLRSNGVQVELFGSVARGAFKIHSDVDFLIIDKGGLSETDVFNKVSDQMSGTPFDIVFLEHLPLETAKLLRLDAHS